MLFLCFVLFFFGAKLNEGVCIPYYDFHNLVERSLGKRRVGGSQRKHERQTPEDQTPFSGFQGPRKDRKPSFSPSPLSGRIPVKCNIYKGVSEDWKRGGFPFTRSQISTPIFLSLNQDSCTIPTGTSAGCQSPACDAAHHCNTVFAPT